MSAALREERPLCPWDGRDDWSLKSKPVAEKFTSCRCTTSATCYTELWLFFPAVSLFAFKMLKWRRTSTADLHASFCSTIDRCTYTPFIHRTAVTRLHPIWLRTQTRKNEYFLGVFLLTQVLHIFYLQYFKCLFQPRFPRGGTTLV